MSDTSTSIKPNTSLYVIHNYPRVANPQLQYDIHEYQTESNAYISLQYACFQFRLWLLYSYNKRHGYTDTCLNFRYYYPLICIMI